MLLDPTFEIQSTGFSIPEIDGLVEGLKPEEPGNRRRCPAPGGVGCRGRRPGNIWIMEVIADLR